MMKQVIKGAIALMGAVVLSTGVSAQGLPPGENFETYAPSTSFGTGGLTTVFTQFKTGAADWATTTAGGGIGGTQSAAVTGFAIADLRSDTISVQSGLTYELVFQAVFLNPGNISGIASNLNYIFNDGAAQSVSMGTSNALTTASGGPGATIGTATPITFTRRFTAANTTAAAFITWTYQGNFNGATLFIDNILFNQVVPELNASSAVMPMALTFLALLLAYDRRGLARLTC